MRKVSLSLLLAFSLTTQANENKIDIAISTCSVTYVCSLRIYEC